MFNILGKMPCCVRGNPAVADDDDPWIFWLPVLYLYFVPFIGFQIKYDDDDDDDLDKAT